MGRNKQPRSVGELKDSAERHLKEYTDPTKSYAFRTYDEAAIHTDELTPADVLMANLLSLRLTWREVTPLFAEGSGPSQELRLALDDALAEARDLPPLEDCTVEQAAMPALRTANDLTAKVPRWTMVTVSKVLHRLAPTVPIIDSSIRAFYGSEHGGELRQRIRADLIANRAWLSDLAVEFPVRKQPMALTRVADIVIWMDSRSPST
ncbi:hypothetical protein FB561_7013 [Kribbella amoyensis]|uniref:Uncharacterized protein n=1 Tax=Kribbella amoyensis TaxID=996641 RepID=A0A561B2P3_9ACTN|nr:DUF6308 family protein [Kribbella amoyensis]TWD73128.1 hypothetical protein FB561_7013 [Kribbella amoyensis]